MMTYPESQPRPGGQRRTHAPQHSLQMPAPDHALKGDLIPQHLPDAQPCPLPDLALNLIPCNAHGLNMTK